MSSSGASTIHRHCPACGKLTEFKEIYRKWGYPVCRCVACGMGIADVLPDSGEVLATLFESLNPNGVIVITTGDWDSLASRVAGRRWRLMTPPQHLSFFSVNTLSLLLKRSGYKILRVSHPWKRVPLGLMAYQLGNRLHLRLRFLEKLNTPVNLFDAMRIIARKEHSK